MKNLIGVDSYKKITAFCCIVLLLPAWLPNSSGAEDGASLSAKEKLRLGERMYREGILPSGKLMKALVKGEASVPGMAFSCESCHLRSGLGSLDAGVFTPPTSGPKLFKPFQAYSSPGKRATPFKPVQIDQQNLKYFETMPRRPVYTDASLAYALRQGVDSAGRPMNDIMPRYLLDDEDMNILISYLKSLSSEFSPGVTDTTIRFATIVTDDVAPEELNAMLVPLETFFRNKNLTNFFDPRAGSRSTGYRSRVMAETTLASLGVGIRKLSLSRWVLHGPPGTWRGQLEEYNRKEPVFALLGGMTHSDWQAVHRFCEEHHIPALFPMTDFPVISQNDWYTLYLSRGYYQEGEGAARFLNEKDEIQGKQIVQIVRDTRKGRELARGFQETWRDLGQTPPVTLVLKPEETVTPALLQQASAAKAGILVLWDGPESLKTLELLATGKNRPEMVVVSSSFLGQGTFRLDKNVSDFTYITYPYGVSQSPQERSPSSMSGIKSFNATANAVTTTRIAQQAYILTLVLNMALTDMKGNYYRDNLLDVIGMIMDLDVPLYDRLSFGTGQRYASKGCYVVQAGETGLVKKSGWLMH